MVSRRKVEPEPDRPRPRRATTPEGRENQLMALAVDLAEKQIREGTVSAQVLSHYLKLASSREQLEQQRLRHENELLRVKAEALASAKSAEELFERAVRAMKSYSGNETEERDD